ncbi:MAG: gephyrin-like molybdotransferase Glp [Pseudomonadota bacterium]
MISVDDALAHLFELVTAMRAETVPLSEASGRVMVRDAFATRDQPPFPSSAMDGYAVDSAAVTPGAKFTVIGESAAGHSFKGAVQKTETVRIFTGAPVPAGTDRVIIQEDVTRTGDKITLGDALDAGPYVRPRGTDFTVDDAIRAPRRLRPSDIALLASMNVARVTVTRKPSIALISTGDELVLPGETPNEDQIIASNTYGLKAMLDAEGAEARILPIAKDNVPSLTTAFELAQDSDMIVTIGGASVGDHDLVADVAETRGLRRAFYKIRMRPGKPLMAGKMGDKPMVGLPGNPVSAMVCGKVFLIPMVRVMQGFPGEAAPRHSARLAADIGKNGPREHYMRAIVENGEITPAERQDSSLLSVLARSNALMIRAPDERPREKGELMEYLHL